MKGELIQRQGEREEGRGVSEGELLNESGRDAETMNNPRQRKKKQDVNRKS